MTNFLSNYLVSLVALVGLIVLVAMGKVDASVALPIIVGLTGVHIGLANGGNTTTVVQPTPAPSQQAAEVEGAKK